MQVPAKRCRKRENVNGDPFARKLTVAAAAAAHHARIGAADSIYIRGIDDGDDDTPEFT